jgi:hypothetical protein
MRVERRYGTLEIRGLKLEEGKTTEIQIGGERWYLERGCKRKCVNGHGRGE